MCAYIHSNNDKCVSCFAKRRNFKNLRLFRFPKHEKRCKQWVFACQLKRLLDVPAEFLHKRYRLCSQHFTDEDYTSPKMDRLKPTACPSKFDFGEKSIVSKLKEGLKIKLSKSVKDNDCQFSGENIDVPESENMMDSAQVLTSAPNEKTNFVETGSKDRTSGVSVHELVNNEVSSNKFEVNEAVLLDISMNEIFYSPEHRKALTNCLSKSCISQSNGNNISENNIQSKEKLNAESSFKALKKQRLDAETKATTAKRDSTEQQNMFTNCLSKSCNSQSKDSNIPENNIHSKEKLKSESSFRALKKQCLDAETKAATAKMDSTEQQNMFINCLSKPYNSQSNGSNVSENNIQSKEKLKSESSFKALKKHCLDAETKTATSKSDSIEQRNMFTNYLSKPYNSQSKDSNIPGNNIHSKEKLKSESSFKALKKQWLDAEIKAATARRDYYEMKRVMLIKLQNDLDFENSSNFQISSAIRCIKIHLNKDECASKMEKKMLKQQLEVAEILANNCEIEYCEPKLEIMSSSDEM